MSLTYLVMSRYEQGEHYKIATSSNKLHRKADTHEKPVFETS